MRRYVSSNEAVWRILNFPIHERYPAVYHLSIHLEDGQRVVYTEANAHLRVSCPTDTTLTAFFRLCRDDTFAKTLLYSEAPNYFTWNKSSKVWQRRKQGTPVEGHVGVRRSDCLGRVYAIHPNQSECFYLRMLLHVVRGPESFRHLRTIDGRTCDTYREACQRLGLLESDNHWDLTLNEAIQTTFPKQLRSLFAVILTTCHPANPKELWNKYKDFISEDILRDRRRANPDENIEFNDDIYNDCLIEIDNLCFNMCGKGIGELDLDPPEHHNDQANPIDRALFRERNYNVSTLEAFVNSRISMLNIGQRQVYNDIIEKINSDVGAIIFLEAPGGTGKTFLLNLILATLRKENKIALAVASSGIAATLLDGGRTAHSTFKLPLNIGTAENPSCNISKSCNEGKVLKDCKLIVWDECTMSHKNALEALNRTLKDIKGKPELMGGIVVLLSGDFRQILPVVKNGSPADELDACLKSSDLWSQVHKMSLSENMRVHLHGDENAQNFTDILLQVGNGDRNDRHSDSITLTSELCQVVKSLDELMSTVYPDITSNLSNDIWFEERAILAPRNDSVTAINNKIQTKMPGETSTYYSIDTVVDNSQAVMYPTEFLNKLEIAGLPAHKLTLKIGSPIMCLRNINPPVLCNGTRLRIRQMLPNTIKAVVIAGNST